jgi:hypothetical protein
MFVKAFNVWMQREHADKTADGIMKRRLLDRSCVQGTLVHVSRVLLTNENAVLIGFTVASLNEDAYGTLQQDIPRVLEVLTKELIALEEYDGELIAGVDGGSKDLEEVRDAQTLILGPLANGERAPIYSLILNNPLEITQGLREIISTFGDRLNVFRLPLPVARKLQLIADAI